MGKEVNKEEARRNEIEHTGKEEHISAMASPTNQVKNVTTTHPHIKLAGPAYNRLCPYRGVPVNTAIHENVIASVLKKLCKQNKTN